MRFFVLLILGSLIFGPVSARAAEVAACAGKTHPYQACDAFAKDSTPTPSCQTDEAALERIRISVQATLTEDILGRARSKRLSQLEAATKFALRFLQCSLTLQSTAASSDQKSECTRRQEELKSRLRLLVPRVRQALFLSGTSVNIQHPLHGSKSIPPVAPEERAQAESRRSADLGRMPSLQKSFKDIGKTGFKPDRLQQIYRDEYDRLMAQAPFLAYFSASSVDADSDGSALTEAIQKWYVKLEEERKRTLDLHSDERLPFMRDRTLINEVLRETKPALTKEACEQAEKLLSKAEDRSRRADRVSLGLAVGGATICLLNPPGCLLGMSTTNMGGVSTQFSEAQERYDTAFAQFLMGTGCQGELQRVSDERDLALLMIPLSVTGAGGGSVRGVLKSRRVVGVRAGEIVESSVIKIQNAQNMDELLTAVNKMKGDIDGAVTGMTDKEIYDYLSAWTKSQEYLPGLSKETAGRSFDDMIKNMEQGEAVRSEVAAVSRTLYNNASPLDQMSTYASIFDVHGLKGVLAPEVLEAALPGRVFQEFTQRVANDRWGWDKMPVKVDPSKVKQGMESWYDPAVGVWNLK